MGKNSNNNLVHFGVTDSLEGHFVLFWASLVGGSDDIEHA